MQGGIYQIASPNGGRYIGSAKNFAKRKREHFTALVRGDHPNRLLRRAFAKYGEALQFSILLVCRQSDLFFYEQILLDAMQPSYNINPLATGTRGLKWSNASRAAIVGKRSRDGAKISAGMKRNIPAAERSDRAKHARSCWTGESKCSQISKLIGRKDSDTTRAKKSAALIGRPVSEDTKAKLASQKGWKHSEEAKAKMRAARAARRNSVDYEVNVSTGKR